MEKEFRRKAPRRHYNGSIGVLFKGKLTTTQCTQLGEGGALIHSDATLSTMKEDDEMVITLFLPSIGGIVAYAQCVYRSGDHKIGLQFRELEMDYKVRVREFVSRRKVVNAEAG